jgi:hypothetical protein
MLAAQPHDPTQNYFLAALPAADYQCLPLPGLVPLLRLLLKQTIAGPLS